MSRRKAETVISLVERSRVGATPAAVWGFFREMDANYGDLHPEHLRWRTLRGEPLAAGTVWFADEWIGSMRVSARFFVDASDPERYFSYRIGLPSSLARAGGSFRFEPGPDQSCEIIQEVHFGVSVPLVGWLLDRLLAVALPIGELRRHMREEQQNLKWLVGRR